MKHETIRYVSFAGVKEKQGLIDYGKLHLLLAR